MKQTEAVLIHDKTGAVREIVHRFDNGVSLHFTKSDDVVNPSFGVRFHPEGAACDHMTVVETANPQPRKDWMAATHLPEEADAVIAAVAASYLA